MFKNYLKSALRNLWKNKGFTTLNIAGLAAGLAVCLLITLYVIDELGYDRYNDKAGRIYRLDADIFFNNTHFDATVSPEPLGPAMLKDFPQVENYVRLHRWANMYVKKDNQTLLDDELAWADSSFFKVFSIPLIAGDPATALNQPRTIVIDETMARKYFNSTDVLGKTLFVDNTTLVKITGVMKNIPAQSHFHFHFIRPFVDLPYRNPDYWLSNNSQTYVLVKPGVTREILQNNVNTVIKNYLGKQVENDFRSSLNDLEKQGNYFRYPVMPLTDIHLKSDKSYELEPNGDMQYVYIFSVIAIFILLIACVNFMNLSTARSANRAKEVGIRKVSGSLRIDLIIQFLVESVLISLFSLMLALGIAALLLPWFNQLAGKEMAAATLLSGWLLPFLVTLILVVGIIAGSYPAFYLSSFKPIQVLKGKIAGGFKRSTLRSSLVVFQFSVSIILIIGTIIIFDQLSFIRNRKTGYDRNHVMVLHNTWTLNQQAKTFRERITKIAGVENATITTNIPTEGVQDQSAWFREATMDATRAVITTNLYVDEHYIPTLGMEMAEGRAFSKDFASDSTAVILNEAAVKLLGFKEPLKEYLYSPWRTNEARAYHVIGVVKDFNFSSMRNKVGPLAMILDNNTGKVTIRINAKNIPALVKQVENTWNSMVPGQPFNYSFMDADFNKLYKAEQRTGKLFISFAVFAIFIACLGLFGLVTYAAEQRKREIGIRKVLGAGTTRLVALLSKDFAKLVLIASIISFPVAWWMMHKWLEDFAYRVDINWWVFAIAGTAAVAIALITVSFQAIKAALANPVASLRSE